MKNHQPLKKIIIVGGGFGGIKTALDLAKLNPKNSKIVLISDKPHFEYTPALYRVVTGRSPLEVCIPLAQIFKNKNVEVLEDSVIAVDLKKKIISGRSGSHYNFDFLVLALGSETIYFNIPGLKNFSFGFKSISEALRLKQHLHKIFIDCEKATQEERVCAGHIVIVGGGASGAELAGELILYALELAKRHRLDPSLIAIDLIEAAPRLIPGLPPDLSEKIKNRLHHLGVNIFLNRAVVKEEVDEIFMKDMEIKTKTVIWTAGVIPHRLYSQIQGLSFDKKGRVLTDKFLEANGVKDVFVIGDAADTPYSGMAQTAIADGKFVARVIFNKIYEKPSKTYQPQKPKYALPIGRGWAAVLIGRWRIYGRLGFWLRRLADLRFFLSILSPGKAILAYRSGKTLCESCSICENKNY